jgi:hypothetical protein
MVLDFLISTFLSNCHSKFPTIWTIFFQFSITFNNSFLPFQFPYPSIFATCCPFPEIFTSFPFPPNRANSHLYFMVPNNSTKFEIRSQVISGNHWGRTEGWTDTYTSNQTKGIKLCTVVWYHKIQIKFEFQCDQIIGSKVVTIWRLKICETWRGMKIQGKQFLIILKDKGIEKAKRNC